MIKKFIKLCRLIVTEKGNIGKHVTRLGWLQTEMATAVSGAAGEVVNTKKKFSWNNIGIGAAIQIFEVSTLGQPFEVIKTHMAGIAISIVYS